MIVLFSEYRDKGTLKRAASWAEIGDPLGVPLVPRFLDKYQTAVIIKSTVS